MAIGRVHERDLVVPSLRLAAERPGGHISTTDLIEELAQVFNPTGLDAQILDDRNDTRFSQKVRNLVSHRESNKSFIKNGYAEYVNGGIKITDKGLRLLDQLADVEA